jgi:hypothetical protein
MLYLPDGRACQHICENAASIDDVIRILRPVGNIFLASPACVRRNHPSIHVVQDECLLLPISASCPVVVFSTGATTCLIAVLIDRRVGRASIVHHDENTITSTSEAIPLSLANMQRAELFVVGAFADVKGTGRRILSGLLTRLHASSIAITLKLLCVDDANTDATSGAPLCQSLGVVLPGGHVFPMTTWPDRGPHLYARMSQSWYDANQRTVIVRAFCEENNNNNCWELEYELIEGEIEEGVRMWTVLCQQYDDAQLLTRVSTSPIYELPAFVDDMRRVFAWLLHQQGPQRRVKYRSAWNGKR